MGALTHPDSVTPPFNMQDRPCSPVKGGTGTLVMFSALPWPEQKDLPVTAKKVLSHFLTMENFPFLYAFFFGFTKTALCAHSSSKVC